MNFCAINAEQAESVLKIFQEECCYTPHGQDGLVFMRRIVTHTPAREHVCHEYRLCGGLGFGGKFRNNGNNDNIPYVDCYPEDRTKGRDRMIARANARLKKLFSFQLEIGKKYRNRKGEICGPLHIDPQYPDRFTDKYGSWYGADGHYWQQRLEHPFSLVEVVEKS